ncbi:MAG TPA: hypothetical protein VMV92_41035 [Streptosporangiaceae bacterium]|nr:hypothetical protein [Streptosporangiaceae bacterium]
MVRDALACHDAIVRPYAAYLRVYEPLSAFGRAEGRRWADYAASPQRPRRAVALDAEQAEALGRLIATPPIAAPQQESVHAYVRWADGVTYICPWQTRLRCWLSLTRLQATSRPLLSTAFAHGQADQALHDFACWQGRSSSLRVYIQACTWSVPPAWFVPFAPEERWLVLGGASDLDARGPATASATRTLIYATAMSQARRRIARALSAVRGTGGEALTSQPGLGVRADDGNGDGTGDSRASLGTWPAGVEIAQVGRWLEEFHPHSVVELDYGGLVHLLDDDALRGDQSVAEVSAAISASREGQQELAAVLYQRLRSRWQTLESLEAAN